MKYPYFGSTMHCMTALSVITGTDTVVLRTKTKPVAKVTKDIVKLLKDMEDTLYKAEGVGIAAPQVNSSHRICLALINQKLIPMINPEITWKSDELLVAEEGCLSLPNVSVDVPRASEITVKYLDTKGQSQERRLVDWDARIVQHEVDHLDGILIVDYR